MNNLESDCDKEQEYGGCYRGERNFGPFFVSGEIGILIFQLVVVIVEVWLVFFGESEFDINVCNGR